MNVILHNIIILYSYRKISSLFREKKNIIFILLQYELRSFISRIITVREIHFELITEAYLFENSFSILL